MAKAENLIAKFNSLKTLPQVAVRVTQLVNSEKSTMQDFEEVIKLDPILVTRLLRLVNSPYFGLATKVESISKAVVYVGMKNLRNLVAVEALRELYADRNGEAFSRESLWLHSATVAILAEMIAKRIFGRAGEDYFLTGILHDIGLIVEAQFQGKQLGEACALYQPGELPLPVCEQKTIGTDHCQVGAALARDWKMPKEVLAAIRRHHDHEKPFPLTSITSILQLAEHMAGKLNYAAIPGKIDPLPPPLVQHVRSMMPNYKIIIRDLPQEMAKAKDLYETTPRA